MFIVNVPLIDARRDLKKGDDVGKKILEELGHFSANESGIPIVKELLDLEEISFNDLDLDRSFACIYKNSLEVFEAKPKTIFLGESHSISYPILKAFFEHCSELDKEPCLIIFDAHTDCFDFEKKDISPKNWLRMLIESDFPSENIFIVSARNFSSSELLFLRKNNVKVMGMNQIFEDIYDSCDILMEFSQGKELYVSIDIGCIDSVFAPAVDYPEPGGLTSRQLIYMLQRIKKVKNLKGLDIVGINPQKQGNELTIKLGAKILSELI